MNLISEQAVNESLELVEEISARHELIDVHVHATEVVFGQQRYSDRQGIPGLYSSTDSPFTSPRPARIRELTSDDICCFSSGIRSGTGGLALSAAYQHIGAPVIAAHMAAAFFQKVYVLPVARSASDIQEQMKFLSDCRRQDQRIEIGYSVPPDVPAEQIWHVLQKAKQCYEISIVKLHPNLSHIDLRSSSRREWVEALLLACGRHRLPVLVHGGFSPILRGERSGFSALDLIQQIDWEATDCPVIVAHCGLYGAADLGPLPILRQILDRHKNVLVDTSGLSSRTLAAVLDQIDDDRILFGSDALYTPIWHAAVIAIQAMRLCGLSPTDTFTRIASTNPTKHLRPPERTITGLQKTGSHGA